MDKKNVIGSLNNTRKRKPSKKLVDSIRKEAFQNAYPDQEPNSLNIAAEKDPAIVEQKQETFVEETQTSDQRPAARVETNGEAETRQEVKKSNRGRKKKENSDGPHEFTTLNCTQPTLNRAKISSALTKTPMYQFVDEAIDHYIRHLKKSGKITLDI